jgi:hypothetical protein
MEKVSYSGTSFTHDFIEAIQKWLALPVRIKKMSTTVAELFVATGS